MKYMLITNNPSIAQYATECGVQRIFLDMEYIGKDVRQGGLDTHKAKHTIGDIIAVRAAVPQNELLVRINPIHDKTRTEVEDVINAGADVIMLPMFTSTFEVKQLVTFVNKRAKICLLLETPQALARIDSILEFSDDIDEIHIGLNDLHLGLRLDFMFEVLSGGLVDYLFEKIKGKNSQIKVGFGGIAKIGEGNISAEKILGEHVRLNSQMVILSRAFRGNCNTLEELKDTIDLKKEIDRLDKCVEMYKNSSSVVLENNKHSLYKEINEFVKTRIYAKCFDAPKAGDIN